jgi:iron complex outermembrane receptor protein
MGAVCGGGDDPPIRSIAAAGSSQGRARVTTSSPPEQLPKRPVHFPPATPFPANGQPARNQDCLSVRTEKPMKGEPMHTICKQPLAALAAALFIGGNAGPAFAQEPATPAERKLPEVKVWGEIERARDVELGASRLGESQREAPRSVSVVPREILDAQAVRDERDVLRNASGVNVFGPYWGTYTSFTVRGLWAHNVYNYFRDGARFVHLLEPPLFNIERVEVVKGPSAIDFGQIAPGGLINYVSKQPSREWQRHARLSLGSFGHKGLEFDLTGPLGEALAFRLTGGIERDGQVARGLGFEKQGLGGSFAWQLGRGTRLTLLAERQDFDTATYGGLAVPDPANLKSADRLDIRNFYGEPGARGGGRHELSFGRFAPCIHAGRGRPPALFA